LRQYVVAILVLSLRLSASPQQSPDSSPSLLGFSPTGAKSERDWEEKYKTIPEAGRIHANMSRLAAHPHHVGSEYQRQNAEWIASQYREWGWDARIERFDVLYPVPKVRVLELLEPDKFIAKLDEPALPGDPYTKEKATQLPGYNIYSADGDVTAPLVYVNYGMPDDYKELERHGISVSGSIVIARYGQGWRGLKPKLAAEHGALGCIIYSDPADDGYVQGDILPKGPMRPPDGIQRGSVADMTLYAGDPLTPGLPSIPGVKRLSISEAQPIMKIPVLPIGYGDAKPFLAALQGEVVPQEWRGGLPFPYHFGPGPAKVHLKLQFDWGQKPVLDVIATMKGSTEPGVWIVRGNHYDAWVNGADDPISGQSALLEEARALGVLAKQGWRPKRTLIYAAWDGEEPGLLGSTEWAEAHAQELDKHAAVYINSDENGRGLLEAGGSHELEDIVNEVATAVIDPETKVSVWKRQQAALILHSGSHGRNSVQEILARRTLPLSAIGSGSDFAGFLDHLGIPCVNLGYGGEDRSGTYHSAYDTPWFTDHFGDKDEVYGPVMAQTAGALVMRFANADILPYNFNILAETLRGYSNELKVLNKTLQAEARNRQKWLDMKVYALTDDPQQKLQPPASLVAPPNMDFSALDEAIDSLEKAATSFAQGQVTATALPAEKLAAANLQLATADRKLLSDSGLPRRPWVRNIVYAPGTYAGYGVKTLPGIREALEQGRYPEAKEQLAVAVKAINNQAEFLQAITASLK
jgi:N-acetylated-alpha-linked acidic dipeptidase